MLYIYIYLYKTYLFCGVCYTAPCISSRGARRVNVFQFTLMIDLCPLSYNPICVPVSPDEIKHIAVSV